MDDSELRKLFHGAREADEASAPELPRIRRRAPGRPATSRRLPWGLIAISAAAALAVGLGLLLVGRGPGSPSREALPSGVSEADARTLEEWTAPTDFLLETPGRELLGSLPPIGSSIPEISVTSPSTTPKGT